LKTSAPRWELRLKADVLCSDCWRAARLLCSRSIPNERGGRNRPQRLVDARAYGTLTVPSHVWRTLQRLGAWIEPVLIAEWARLVRAYGERMERTVTPGEVGAALVWLDPGRDTQLARAIAKRLLDRGHRLTCVWTGVRMGDGAGMDIDHCLPWSAWPSGDLWNLLPTTPRVNQHLKRDRLPSASALAGAQRNIISWWGRRLVFRSSPESSFRSRSCGCAAGSGQRLAGGRFRSS
jgi:hypothetical protein